MVIRLAKSPLFLFGLVFFAGGIYFWSQVPFQMTKESDISKPGSLHQGGSRRKVSKGEQAVTEGSAILLLTLSNHQMDLNNALKTMSSQGIMKGSWSASRLISSTYRMIPQ